MPTGAAGKSDVSLTVVIPVFNEEATIGEIVARAQATGLAKEIIIVDDGSTDSTAERVQALTQEHANVRAFRHEQNCGKGAALRTGFAAVTGNVVIIQDADLEYDPAEYGRLLQPILEGQADVVFGSRFLGGPHRVLLFWHYVGNRFLTLLSNALNNLNLSDMETCYKAFRAEVLKDIEIESDRFDFEPEFTAKVARHRLRVYEVPISYHGRGYDEGKKITWRDGLSALLAIIRFRFF
jgi:glycosyltransferase involved in cell wall biosynthesis